MLGIRTNYGTWHVWHLGNEIPEFVEDERVVTFQADGDELNLFLQAMAATREPLRGSRIGYSKLGGFEVFEEE